MNPNGMSPATIQIDIAESVPDILKRIHDEKLSIVDAVSAMKVATPSDVLWFLKQNLTSLKSLREEQDALVKSIDVLRECVKDVVPPGETLYFLFGALDVPVILKTTHLAAYGIIPDVLAVTDRTGLSWVKGSAEPEARGSMGEEDEEGDAVAGMRPPSPSDVADGEVLDPAFVEVP